MTLRRIAAASAAAAALVLVLTGCFGLPGLPGGNPGGDPIPVEGGGGLVDTTWSGTDSDGDRWEMTFQSDGTVGLVLNGNSYDDATDTWEVSDGMLEIEIALVSGLAQFEGPYVDGGTQIPLVGVVAGHEFELILQRR